MTWLQMSSFKPQGLKYLDVWEEIQRLENKFQSTVELSSEKSTYMQYYIDVHVMLEHSSTAHSLPVEHAVETVTVRDVDRHQGKLTQPRHVCYQMLEICEMRNDNSFFKQKEWEHRIP